MEEIAPHRPAKARWLVSQTDPVGELGGGPFIYDGLPTRYAHRVGPSTHLKFQQAQVPDPEGARAYFGSIRGFEFPRFRPFFEMARCKPRPGGPTFERAGSFRYARLWGLSRPPCRT